MDEKKWYTSKTVWSTILLFIVLLLRAFKQDTTAAAIEQESGAVADYIMQFIPMILTAIAFYGRITAKAKIKP